MIDEGKSNRHVAVTSKSNTNWLWDLKIVLTRSLKVILLTLVNLNLVHKKKSCSKVFLNTLSHRGTF